jgi:predicted Zn finger-like uncharacterized protein
MLIVCPTCTAPYEVELVKLAPKGRKVRCARCNGTWFAATAVEVPELVRASVQTTSLAGLGKTDSLAGGGHDEPLGGLTDPGRTGEPAFDQTESATPADTAIAVIDGPSLVPVEPESIPGPILEAKAEGADIETRAARPIRPRAARRKKPRVGPRLAGLILGLAAILAGLIAWRGQVVRLAPQSAALFSAIGLPVNLRGLMIENVKTLREVQDGVIVLIVEGTIANVVNRTVEVPRLRFALRNPAGLEVYAWTSVSGRSALGPGETTSFRTRLASPPADGREVVVRFFHRRDIVASLQ